MHRQLSFAICFFLFSTIYSQDVHIEGDIVLNQGANRGISMETGGNDFEIADDLIIQGAHGAGFGTSGGHLFLRGGNGGPGNPGVTFQKGGDVIIRPGESSEGHGSFIVQNGSGTNRAIFEDGVTRFLSPTVTEGSVIVGTPGDGNSLLTLNSSRSWAFKQSGFDASTTLVLQSVGGGGNKNFVINTTGDFGIGILLPAHPLHMASGAHVTAGGAWTNASSRSLKENIHDLTVEEAISTMEALNVVRFNYLVQKDEEYVGFIAEDVPELVANQGRKSLGSMDIVAVLTKVIQVQHLKINELSEQVSDLITLRNEMAELKQLLQTHVFQNLDEN